MNVLQLVDSLRLGGSESLAATLALAFAARGHGAMVCGLGQDGPLRNRLEARGIPVAHLNCSSGVQPGAMLRLGGLMSRQRTAVALTHHFRQLVHALPAATLLRRRIVHVEHDYHSYESRPDVVTKLGRMAPLVHAFLFVSDEIRNWFVDRLPQLASKAMAIPNGVDTARFSPNPESRAFFRGQLHLAPEDFLIGACARLEPVKGLDLLLQSFSRLPAQLPAGGNLHLALVGEGSQRGELEQLARELNLKERVHFLGLADNVPDWLNAFDAYALTSCNEGLPLSLMEAMSTGVPVVAVDVGSVAKVVDDQVGELVRCRLAEPVSEALARLAADRHTAQALGVAGRRRIQAAHSLDRMVNQYLSALGANGKGLAG